MPGPPADQHLAHPRPPPKNLVISAVNINSITAPERLQELNDFVAVNHVDVLALSELKIDSTVHPSLYTIANFHTPVVKYRSRKGGGTGLYVRNCLPFSRLNDYENEEFEAVWVKIKMNSACVIICSNYLPPHSPAEKQIRFLDYITDCVMRAQEHLPTAVVITGDHNAGNCWLPADSPHHSPITSFERKLRSTSEALSLSQLIKTATRIQGGVYNIRDLIFTDRPDLVVEAGILPPFSNIDHVPIYATLNLQYQQAVGVSTIQVWDYKNTNIGALVETLRQTDWRAITDLDVDEATELFTTTLLDAAKQCIPCKSVRLKRDKPWVTSELRKNMKKRDRLFKIARDRQTEYHWARWRAQRNIVTSLNRRLKHENLKNKVAVLLENKADPYKYHTILKNITGLRRQHGIPPLVLGDDILSNDSEKAEAFNAYFCTQTDIQLSEQHRQHLQSYQEKHPETPFSINTIQVTSNDVIRVINGLDSSKACGPDQLPTKILKMSAAYIAEPLAKIFNKSISSGHFPTAWKTATVKPVYKGKGSPSEIKNYRPISLLPCTSKIFEKLIFARIYEHITKNALLTDKQSGYRPGHNTQLQLIYLTNKLYRSLNDGQDFSIVYLDISRYFEKIWHDGLLAKCKKEFGISGSLLSWLKSYLGGRNQIVQTGCEKSVPLVLRAGVPQGSVLGPLLAIMYLNGLSKQTENGMLFFADDSSLHASHSPQKSIQVKESLQRDLHTIFEYGKNWAITFNANKTAQQIFSTKKNTQVPELQFGDQPIPLTDSHKHLGLTISTDLRFKQHIDETLTKFNRTIGPLYKISRYLPRATLILLYKMYVQPHLDYCDAVYDGHLTSFDCQRLEKAQTRAARLITGTTRRTSASGLLQELGLSTLTDRRQEHRLQLYHRLKFDQVIPHFIKDMIPNTRSTDNPRTLRSTMLFVHSQPAARLSSYANSFVPKTTRNWNELPVELRKSVQYKQFKQSLHKIKGPSPPNPFLSHGSKLGNILHTKIRLLSSNLNAHKFAIGKASSPACSCGHRREDSNHFLLQCPNHATHRRALFQTLSSVLNTSFQNASKEDQLQTLIFGAECNKSNGMMVASAVQEFLFTTRRFTNKRDY